MVIGKMLNVIGAGVGRTGTTSLMVALEYLLQAPCYHMAKLNQHPEHLQALYDAAKTIKENSIDQTNWTDFFKGYKAMTDWPAAAFYPSLMRQFPEAKVLLSVRDPELWYQSCKATIIPKILQSEGAWGEMIRTVIFATFTEKLEDKDACIKAFIEHNQQVQNTVPKDRLIYWQVGDGWKPLSEGLGIDIPCVDFPCVNTTKEFLQRG